MPVGLLAQPPGGFPIVHDPVSHVENKAMSDRVKKWFQILAVIVGAIFTLIGKNDEVKAETAAAAGAYESNADAAKDVAAAGNKQTAGFASLLSAVVIPFAFDMLSKWRGGKKLEPGWNAVADAGALQTLKKITRAGRADDMVHIDALIASGVLLETQARIDGSV